MERASFPEPPQMSAALLKFIFFLRDVIEEQQWHFEQLLEQCHPEDVRVLLLWMEPHGPLMVKDVARELGDVNLSRPSAEIRVKIGHRGNRQKQEKRFLSVLCGYISQISDIL